MYAARTSTASTELVSEQFQHEINGMLPLGAHNTYTVAAHGGSQSYRSAHMCDSAPAVNWHICVHHRPLQPQCTLPGRQACTHLGTLQHHRSGEDALEVPSRDDQPDAARAPQALHGHLYVRRIIREPREVHAEDVCDHLLIILHPQPLVIRLHAPRQMRLSALYSIKCEAGSILLLHEGHRPV